ncbi:MAG: flagellar export chaperone FliS [Phycisphaeraceae bacterium]|nr:flagellar export chaperone FliS [Phycisphaeraceae bacterium]
MSVATHSANTYLRTRVMTASREELRLLLLEGAIKFVTQAKEGLLARNFEQVFQGTDNARNIIVELITSVQSAPNPELAEKVRSLYTFFYVRLTEASFEKSIEKFEEVIGLLEYERETWVLLMQKVASEKSSDEIAAPSDPDPVAGRAGPFSVQG